MLFSVEGFTTFATFIIWINLFGATMAGVTAIWASKKLPHIMTTILVPISILAFIYSIAYVILLFTPVTFTDWSAVMRGVSITAWFIVWIYPWVRIAQLHKRLVVKEAQSAMAMENLSKLLKERTQAMEGK